MSYDEFFQKCSSDFHFFASFMVWFSLFSAMMWSLGKYIYGSVFSLIRKIFDRFKRKS